ncbi:related to carbonic anhydrase precursor [Phialocephala subalpina]|uniref:Carbonic anhydrase n=1 Tax=Phialocephala subalpina TaxID=576137 RepID=A0A1L7X6M4_9HELO|nr:related to carbonic anhydrase precursor [Phialocephala subalpina]
MFWSISLLALAPAVLACPDHTRSSRSLVSRATGAKDWNYTDPSSWGSIKPEYAICSSGTMQSPIDLPANNFSNTHAPTFKYSATVAGELTNWGYGPSFALNETNGKDYSGNPSFTADGTTYYLIAWHTHTPSEHEISGTSYPAELHLVHGTSSGTVAGVIGIPLTASSISSPFFEQFLGSVPSTTSESHVELDEVYMGLALCEAGNLESYWTYKGSLTTPACTEGLRWWVSGTPMGLSKRQMSKLKGVSGFSSRGVQKIIAQALSV